MLLCSKIFRYVIGYKNNKNILRDAIVKYAHKRITRVNFQFLSLDRFSFSYLSFIVVFFFFFFVTFLSPFLCSFLLSFLLLLCAQLPTQSFYPISARQLAQNVTLINQVSMYFGFYLHQRSSTLNLKKKMNCARSITVD